MLGSWLRKKGVAGVFGVLGRMVVLLLKGVGDVGLDFEDDRGVRQCHGRREDTVVQ